MLATDTAIQKKMYGDMGNLKNFTTLIISNNDLNDLIKAITALEEHDILLEGTNKSTENEIKKQEGGFLTMLLGTLGASLLENLMTGKSLYRTGKGMYRSGNGMYRTGQVLKKY